MNTIRWGIIGCGNVAEVKSGPAFQKAEGSQLLAVMRRNGALAADYAKRHGVPRWYDDADALIHDADVDAVYIATPPSSHMDIALRCAEAGKPAYVEKPMAMNHAECMAMVRAFALAEVPLFVAYYRRALPRFEKVKNLIENGVIGLPRFVSIVLHRPPKPEDIDTSGNWRTNPSIAGGGYFVDLAAHQIDFLVHLFGPIAVAKGFATNQAGLYKAEDIVTGSLRFENGVLGTGVWCFAAFDARDSIQIVGSDGRIEFGCFNESPISVSTARGIEAIPIPNPDHVQQPLIQTVVNELLGKGKSPSTGLSAAHTSWVMDKLLEQDQD